MGKVLAPMLACVPAAMAADAPASRAFAGRDLNVSAGADFFAHANGAWIRDTPIPADRSSYGIDEELQDLTDRRTVEVMRQAAKASAPPGSDVRRIGDYFASVLDERSIEAKGLAPLVPVLDAIAAIGDRSSLALALGRRLRADVDVLNATRTYTPNVFGLWVAQDLDEPTRYAPFLLQGGLGLPDRDTTCRTRRAWPGFAPVTANTLQCS